MVASASPRDMILPDEYCGDYTKWDMGEFFYGSKFKQKDSYVTNQIGNKSGDVEFFNFCPDGFSGFKTTLNNNTVSNISNVLFSKPYIDKVFADLMGEEGKKVPTINAFLNQLFRDLSTNTAGFYNLTIVSEPDGVNLRIVDENFAVATEEINPLKLVQRGQSNFVKSINLNSSLPDGVATTAYAIQRGKTDLGTSNSKSVAKLIGYEEPQQDTDARKENIKNHVTSIVVNGVQLVMLPEGAENTEADEYQKYKSAFLTALGDFIKEFDDAPWNQDLLYTWNLSVTLDGIAGFTFGNVIEIGWLPNRFYNSSGDAKLVFTVTTVEHSLQGNEWTTTINTICRTNPSVKF
jgi:hypothetical protein